MTASLRCLFAVALVLTAGPLRAAAPDAGDAILIVGVSPGKFADGREAQVKVTVAYNLVSADEAVVELGSNNMHVRGFSLIAYSRVKKGNGTIIIPGTFTPRYWTANAPAKLSVNLSGGGDPLVRNIPLASDDTRIVVPPRAAPEKDPKNPNPSILYEDTIEITSVSPDSLVEGVETEVTVTVAYELLSREQGEINLGSSGGRGNGYQILSSTIVPIGRGEATLRARFVPTKTGALPFSKVFVNLSEYPHRETWSPLGGDSHVVEIR
jgi:hypothetical protein